MRFKKLSFLMGSVLLTAAMPSQSKGWQFLENNLKDLPKISAPSPIFQKIPAMDALKALLLPYGITVVRDFETLRADEYLTLVTSGSSTGILSEQVVKILNRAGLTGVFRAEVARLYIKPSRLEPLVDLASAKTGNLTDVRLTGLESKESKETPNESTESGVSIEQQSAKKDGSVGSSGVGNQESTVTDKKLQVPEFFEIDLNKKKKDQNEPESAATKVPQQTREGGSEPVEQERPAATPKQGNVWNLLGSGEKLRTALERWAIASDWRISWEVEDQDFVIEQPAVIEGTFIGAVGKVMDGLKETNLPLKAIAYEGNRVLRVLPANGDK